MMTDLNVWHFECRALYLNLPLLIFSYFCFGLIRSTLKGGWLSLTKLHRKCFIFFNAHGIINFCFVKSQNIGLLLIFFSLSVHILSPHPWVQNKNLYTYKWKMIARPIGPMYMCDKWHIYQLGTLCLCQQHTIWIYCLSAIALELSYVDFEWNSTQIIFANWIEMCTDSVFSYILYECFVFFFRTFSVSLLLVLSIFLLL